MHVLLTGATGFVGGRIASRLIARGHSVTALVRAPSDTLRSAGVSQLTGSVERAPRDMLLGVDSVVHAAGTTSDDIDHARSVNRDGTALLVEAAVESGVKHFVHMSTTAVYDRDVLGDVEVHEDAPLTPERPGARPYSVSKAEAEAEVVRAAAQGLPAVILRPSAVLGAGPTSTWGTRFPSRWRAGQLAPLHPQATRAWVHVEDVVDLVLTVLAGDAVLPADRGVAVNVVAGHTTVQAYLDALRGCLGEVPDVPVAAGRPWRGTFATDRLTALGFTPERSFADAMAEICGSWANGDPGQH
jgi:2-alkyl-3-oxoalkanoate reductase